MSEIEKIEALEKMLNRLLMKVNAVTAYWRHGNSIPNNRLLALSNTQVEIEQELEGVKNGSSKESI